MLAGLLGTAQILIHPFVISEIAMGSLSNRSHIINLMNALPTAETAEHGEILLLVGERRL